MRWWWMVSERWMRDSKSISVSSHSWQLGPMERVSTIIKLLGHEIAIKKMLNTDLENAQEVAGVAFNQLSEIATIHRPLTVVNIASDKRYNFVHVISKTVPTKLSIFVPSSAAASITTASTWRHLIMRSGCRSMGWIVKMNANYIVVLSRPQHTLHWSTESLTERLAHIILLINALTALAFRLGVTMNFIQRPSLICVACVRAVTKRARAITAISHIINSASRLITRTITLSSPWWRSRKGPRTLKLFKVLMMIRTI